MVCPQGQGGLIFHEFVWTSLWTTPYFKNTLVNGPEIKQRSAVYSNNNNELLLWQTSLCRLPSSYNQFA